MLSQLVHGPPLARSEGGINRIRNEVVLIMQREFGSFEVCIFSRFPQPLLSQRHQHLRIIVVDAQVTSFSTPYSPSAMMTRIVVANRFELPTEKEPRPPLLKISPSPLFESSKILPTTLQCFP